MTKGNVHYQTLTIRSQVKNPTFCRCEVVGKGPEPQNQDGKDKELVGSPPYQLRHAPPLALTVADRIVPRSFTVAFEEGQRASFLAHKLGLSFSSVCSSSC